MKKVRLITKGAVVETFVKGDLRVLKVEKVTDKMVYLDGGFCKHRDEVKMLF